MSWHRTLALAAGVVAVAWGACRPLETRSCRSVQDCPAGNICQAGQCVDGCVADADCPDQRVCQQSVCVVPAPCQVDEDCRTGELCLARQCRPQDTFCQSDRDCPLELYCVSGVCGRALSDGGTPDAAPPPADAGTAHDAGHPVPDAGVTTTDAGGCPGGSLSYGQDCTCDAQCVSGICATAGAGRARVCTRACTSVHDCPGTDLCSAWVDPGRSLCAANDVGSPCDDSSPCADHLCLLLPGTNTGGQCTAECPDTNRCPQGYGCVFHPSDPLLKFCAPVGAPCPGGAAQCHTALCLAAASGDQYCTGYCRSQADCPPSYSCAPLNAGSSSYVCKM
ncbi:MAG: hypothetical protein HY904_09135 [Deltaproteobacteria bacterium]|nr:hypothetical protein [Deltaproteobacteria bacterium]